MKMTLRVTRIPRLLVPVLVLVNALVRVTFAQPVAFEEPDSYPTGNVPEPIAIGDLNGDGRLDIVVANTSADLGPGGDSVTVLLSSPAGGFTPGGDYPVGVRPEGIVLEALDGDATLDVATANFTSSSMTLLPGNGDGTFGAASNTPVSGGPRFLLARDLDGDGIKDVATANYSGDSVSILIGDGAGAFTVTGPVGVGDGPEVITSGQIWGNASVDLAVANAIGNSITILQGDGAGGFAPVLTRAVGSRPRFILARDLNGDGFDDLLVANNLSNTVTVEENIGGAAFTTAATLSFSDGGLTLVRPVYLDVADANADGELDVLVAWANSAAATVFPGTGTAFGFGAPSGLETGNTPVGVATADLDGDGDLDLVVSNAGDDTLYVYRSSIAESGIVIDDGAAGTSSTGTWAPSTAPFPYGSSALSGVEGSEYAWTASLAEPALYEVSVWWPALPTGATTVPVELDHALGIASSTVDQTGGYGTWHPIGTYYFTDSATVRMTSPAGATAVADAVRIRRVGQWPAGSVTTAAGACGPEAELSRDTVVACAGTLVAADGVEGIDWIGIDVLPVGEGSVSDLIAVATLVVDADGDGVCTEADRTIAGPLPFPSDTGAIQFRGFREALEAGAPTAFFVVCELAGGKTPKLDCAAAGAAIVAAGLLAFRRPRRRARRFALAAVCLMGILGIGGPGCGGGGGGGGGSRDPLRVQVTEVLAEGRVSALPAAVDGLPVTGWDF